MAGTAVTTEEDDLSSAQVLPLPAGSEELAALKVSSLLTLFDCRGFAGREFLFDRLPSGSAFLPCFYSVARLLHESDKTQRQFPNSFRLPPLNSLGRNQFRAHTEGTCSRQDEIDRCLLIHSSRCDQWNLRQRRLQ